MSIPIIKGFTTGILFFVSSDFFVDEDEELNISSRIKALKMNSFVIGRVKNKKEESSVIFV